MSKQIGGAQMRRLAKKIEKEIPGLGFCLLVFEFHEAGMANYVANAQRADMIKSLRETADRLERRQGFRTPETNQPPSPIKGHKNKPLKINICTQYILKEQSKSRSQRI